MPARRSSSSRYALPILGAFALLAGLLAGCVDDDGRTPLVLYSPHGRDLLGLFEETFEAANPDVDVRWLDMGSQEVFDRIRSGEGEPAGRCLVRWPGDDPGARCRRWPARAVPAEPGPTPWHPRAVVPAIISSPSTAPRRSWSTTPTRSTRPTRPRIGTICSIRSGATESWCATPWRAAPCGRSSARCSPIR